MHEQGRDAAGVAASAQGVGSLHPCAGWPECRGSGVVARDPEVSSSLRHQHADLARLSA